MTKSLISMLSISLLILSSQAWAEPLMSKDQYADYSVSYQCADSKYHNDLEKKETEIMRLESLYGLNDDNFDEFDELITEYEQDFSLLDTIRKRAAQEC